jgi:hypothetical protein
MKHLVAFFFCLSLAGSCVAQAQNTGKTIYNRQNWLIYGARYRLNKRWGIHTDVQFRMDADVKYATTTLLRPGLIRYLTEDEQLVGGYAYGTAYSQTFKEYFTEHRLWEQFNTTHRTKDFNLHWRIRLENRFVQKLKLNANREVVSDGYRFGNRLRLANRTVFDLGKDPKAKNTLYLAGFEEIFLNVAAPDLNKHFFDQNFLMVAIGVFHDKHTRFEIGYLNQFTNPYNRAHNMNHVLQVSLLQNLNIGSVD